MDTITLLTTLDENHLPQLQVLLTSLALNNPGEKSELFLLHSGIAGAALEGTSRRCSAYGWSFSPLPVEDVRWNYDARYYSGYLLRSAGEYDLGWVMQNTSILHFCGKEKPWKPKYIHRFGILYRHYMQLARRETA